MSFIGKHGYFGALTPYTGPYHPSVYAKYARGGRMPNEDYARGGGPAGGGYRLGNAFAYKRPAFSDGGGAEQHSPYKKPPHNDASNDYHQGYQAARGGGDYSFGKVSPRFQSDGAEIEPSGHDNVKRRNGITEDYLRPAQRRAYERDNRFAKGGAAKMTPAWKDRPYPVAQRTSSKGLKIHAPHSGEGLVMNIHLSDVGPHAISFHSGPDGYSGGGDSSRMVQGAAERRLASAARPTPFPAPTRNETAL